MRLRKVTFGYRSPPTNKNKFYLITFNENNNIFTFMNKLIFV